MYKPMTASRLLRCVMLARGARGADGLRERKSAGLCAARPQNG